MDRAVIASAEIGGTVGNPKIAQTQYPVHDLIQRRWSPRAFADRPVPREELCRILEAARWAPSNSNEQPWSFVLATQENAADYDRLFSCLLPGNQLWVRQAPVLMLSVAKLAFDEDQSPNRHAFHDVGLAVENLVIQALALDLFVHQMAGFEVEKAREVCNLPSGFEPVAMIAVGYLGDPSTLPEKLRARELSTRSRKVLAEFVYTGRWGQPASVVMPT
jgi:nitroreductase